MQDVQKEPDQTSAVETSKENSADESSQYLPLDRSVESTFWLLTLLPGPKGSQPHGTLSVNTWQDGHSSYEALSYVWGDLEAGKSIILDGKAFEVTENLFSATSNLKTTLECYGSMPFASTRTASSKEITRLRLWGDIQKLPEGRDMARRQRSCNGICCRFHQVNFQRN